MLAVSSARQVSFVNDSKRLYHVDSDYNCVIAPSRNNVISSLTEAHIPVFTCPLQMTGESYEATNWNTIEDDSNVLETEPS